MILQPPRVSVVIPLYNKAATIGRALTSILNQTYKNFEIIVVDDGSTDNGAEIVHIFMRCNFNIQLTIQNNLGPGAARNKGILLSGSELIAFLDADDEFLPEFLQHSISILDKTKNVAIVSGFYEGPKRKLNVQSWNISGPVTLTPGTPAKSVVALIQYINVWAMVARRDVILKYGGFYENKCLYSEDGYLWIKLVFNESIFIELKPLCWWHNEDSSLSRNLAGPRPIEPFFTDLNDIYNSCPFEMLPLLKNVLALRAGKTATVLSFWGRWYEGRQLLNKFTTLKHLVHPIVVIGQIASTPLGAFAGLIIRKLMATMLTNVRIGSAVLKENTINA